MALLFMDGFEADDSAVKWDTGSMNVSTSSTTRFSTGLSALVNNSGIAFKNYTASSTTIVGFATRTGTTASSVGFVVTFWGDSGTTQHITVQRNQTTGFVEVRRGTTSGTLLATGTKCLLEQVWNYIEVKVTISDTVGTVEVRIDGSTTPDINFSGDTKNGGTNNTLDRLYVYSNSAFSCFIDDFYLCDGTGSTNNNFLGDVRMQTLVPNGNGNYSQLTGSDGNQVNNYQLVDELPYSTTDYVGSYNVGDKDSYTLSDLLASTTTVFALQNNIVASKDDAYVAQARPFLRIGGTDYNGTSQILNTTSQTYYNVYDQNPATSANWTVGGVNGSEIGFEVQ